MPCVRTPCLALLLLTVVSPAIAAEFVQQPFRPIDERAAAAAGVRKLEGKHSVLYTDLPSAPSVDEFPAVFDLAFPQWCKYFGQDAVLLDGWKARGFVIRDKALFQRLGLLPNTLPSFPHGYTLGNEFWLYEQPGDYYTRHLVLHEGTHSFMFTVLGSCGPPWYMEGIAEMLATHRWRGDRLEMNWFPERKEDVPYLGRIKIVRDAYDARKAKSLQAVLDYGPEAHRETEPYAWCWALAAMLDGDPRYRDRFRALPQQVRRGDFTRHFLAQLGPDADALAAQWQVYICELEYGADVARTAIDFAPGKPLPSGGTRASIAADCGWQNTGVRLEAGVEYRVRAHGRYQIADQPRPWPCEPNGVSIRYYRGRPLGILLGAVCPDLPLNGACPMIAPSTIGLDRTLAPKQTGTLFLRVNDSNAELGDNKGDLTVEIERQSP